MITGFNTDIPHEGVTYHVQTEDKGLDTPLILSLVYVGGAIIASKRTPYEDLLQSGFDEAALTERLQRQHKLICAAIRAGRIEDLKRMGERDAPTATGAGGENGAPKKSPGGRKKKSSAEKVAEQDAAQPVAAEAAKPDPKHELSHEPKHEQPAPPPPAQASPDAPAFDGLLILTNLVDEINALSEEDVTRPTDAPAVQSVAAPIHEELPPPATNQQAPASPEADAEQASSSAPEIVTAEVLDESEELYLTILDDEGEFRAGQLATMKIHVGRGTYGQRPVGDASVTVKVLGTTFRPLILTTSTDESGLAIVRALLPRFTSGRAAIIIRAVAGEDAAEMRRIIHQN